MDIEDETAVQEDPALIAAGILSEYGISTMTERARVDAPDARIPPTPSIDLLQGQQQQQDDDQTPTLDPATITPPPRIPSPETMLERAQKQELRRRLIPSDKPIAVVTLDSDEETEVTPSGQIIKTEPAMSSSEVLARRLQVSDHQTQAEDLQQMLTLNPALRDMILQTSTPQPPAATSQEIKSGSAVRLAPTLSPPIPGDAIPVARQGHPLQRGRPRQRSLRLTPARTRDQRCGTWRLCLLRGPCCHRRRPHDLHPPDTSETLRLFPSPSARMQTPSPRMNA